MAESSQEAPPALAEQLQQRKRITALEGHVETLLQRARTHQDKMQDIDKQVKQNTTEDELRRAISLALGEFEQRMQDAFQDSNRKLLEVFSKKEDVDEVQAAISKKVNWNEYHHVLGKLTELRTYVDTTATSVFIGQRDALQKEFSRKADAAAVDMALKSKADFLELNDLRARLERQEMLQSHSSTQFIAKLEELRETLSGELATQASNLKQSLNQQGSMIEVLEGRGEALEERASTLEAQLAKTTAECKKLGGQYKDTQAAFKKVDASIAKTQQQLDNLDAVVQRSEAEVLGLQQKLDAFDYDAQQKMEKVSKAQAKANEQIKFLLDASEALKRRVREIGKAVKNNQEEAVQERGDMAVHINRLETTVTALREDAERSLTDLEQAVGALRGPVADEIFNMRQLGQSAAESVRNTKERLGVLLQRCAHVVEEQKPGQIQSGTLTHLISIADGTAGHPSAVRQPGFREKGNPGENGLALPRFTHLMAKIGQEPGTQELVASVVAPHRPLVSPRKQKSKGSKSAR